MLRLVITLSEHDAGSVVTAPRVTSLPPLLLPRSASFGPALYPISNDTTNSTSTMAPDTLPIILSVGISSQGRYRACAPTIIGGW
ncbi:MAG: hypothetical protein ACOY3Y_10310, partial [Acidobacteriota bacterium]